MSRPDNDVIRRFDRSAAGWISAPRPVAVDRRHLIQFSEAIGETNPIFFDGAAAQAAGYPDIVAPPTFAAVINMAAQHDMRRAGESSIQVKINADYRVLLHGEESFDYHGHIFALDVISHQTRVLGFSESASGSMEFAHLETVLMHEDRGVLVTCRRTLIHTLKVGVAP